MSFSMMPTEGSLPVSPGPPSSLKWPLQCPDCPRAGHYWSERHWVPLPRGVTKSHRQGLRHTPVFPSRGRESELGCRRFPPLGPLLGLSAASALRGPVSPPSCEDTGQPGPGPPCPQAPHSHSEAPGVGPSARKVWRTHLVHKSTPDITTCLGEDVSMDFPPLG